MKNALFLLVRLGGVSLIFFAAISFLVGSYGKDTVAQFINAQNNVIIVAGIGSLGFHSILMYYGARSARLLQWATHQLMLCAPISIFVCFISAWVVEIVNPTLGFATLGTAGVVVASATSLPGGMLGAGKYKEFTFIEIISSLSFLSLVVATGRYLTITPTRIFEFYVVSMAIKIPLYLIGQRTRSLSDGTRMRRHGARWRTPNFALFRRFLGPSWISGNLYAVAYRAMLSIFQLNNNSAMADIALVWSIADRVQNLFQTANLLIYRAATRSKSDFATIRRKVDILYFPIVAICYFFVCVFLLFWSSYVGAKIKFDSLYIVAPLMFWGYRSFQQNLISSQRMPWRIVFDLCLVMVGWGVIFAAIEVWYLSWELRITIMCLVIAISSASLRVVRARSIQ